MIYILVSLKDLHMGQLDIFITTILLSLMLKYKLWKENKILLLLQNFNVQGQLKFCIFVIIKIMDYNIL